MLIPNNVQKTKLFQYAGASRFAYKDVYKRQPHNHAEIGDIAEKVLLPGDPMRAKFIAENFLEDAVCYNEVRGMYGLSLIHI